MRRNQIMFKTTGRPIQPIGPKSAHLENQAENQPRGRRAHGFLPRSTQGMHLTIFRERVITTLLAGARPSRRCARLDSRTAGSVLSDAVAVVAMAARGDSRSPQQQAGLTTAPYVLYLTPFTMYTWKQIWKITAQNRFFERKFGKLHHKTVPR